MGQTGRETDRKELYVWMVVEAAGLNALNAARERHKSTFAASLRLVEQPDTRPNLTHSTLRLLERTHEGFLHHTPEWGWLHGGVDMLWLDALLVVSTPSHRLVAEQGVELWR